MHIGGIPVDARVLLAGELVNHPGHALLPALAVLVDFPDCIPLIEKEVADTETVRQGQAVQPGEHGWPGLQGKTAQGNYADIVVTQNRGGTVKGQITCAKHGIQIHGYWRYPDKLILTGQAQLQVAEQVRYHNAFCAVHGWAFLQSLHLQH